MRKVLILIVATMFAGIMGVSAAVAEPQYSKVGSGYHGGGYYGGGYYQDPYGRPDRRVCCSSRYGVTWSSWRDCRRARGQDVRNKICRKYKHRPNYGYDDGYNGYNNGYNNGYGNGYGNDYDNGHGNGYSQDPYGNPDRRVCCKRGYHDWWSSWRECRRAGGYETANRECRRD